MKRKPVNPMNFMYRYPNIMAKQKSLSYSEALSEVNKLEKKMNKENEYYYFIEDMNTGLWLKNIIRMPQGNTPHTTIFYRNEEYWTMDPHEALKSLSKSLMERTLENFIKNESSFMMTDKYGVYKNLKITEHEFVNFQPSGKEI